MESSSPIATPSTPRTLSPAPFDGDLTDPATSSPHDAQEFLTPREAPSQADSPADAADAVSMPPDAPAAPVECLPSPLKGKGKARTEPLRLLDLPVDILKEIIHQVSLCAKYLGGRRPSLLTRGPSAPAHQRPHFAGTMPFRAAPPGRALHLLPLRHRLAR